MKPEPAAAGKGSHHHSQSVYRFHSSDVGAKALDAKSGRDLSRRGHCS